MVGNFIVVRTWTISCGSLIKLGRTFLWILSLTTLIVVVSESN